MRGGDRITPREKLFADAYLKSFNATKAYMEAYNITDTTAAGRRGYKLKKKAEVKKYIDDALAEITRRARIDATKVVELLAAVAFTSPADFASISEENGKQKIVWKDIEGLDEDVKKAISVIKNTPSGIAIETLDRMKAMDLLMKYLNINEGGEGEVVIEGEKDIEE